MLSLLHPDLHPGDILVADRGLCSYAHLALLMQAGVHAVFRMHQLGTLGDGPGSAASTGGHRPDQL